MDALGQRSFDLTISRDFYGFLGKFFSKLTAGLQLYVRYPPPGYPQT